MPSPVLETPDKPRRRWLMAAGAAAPAPSAGGFGVIGRTRSKRSGKKMTGRAGVIMRSGGGRGQSS